MKITLTNTSLHLRPRLSGWVAGCMLATAAIGPLGCNSEDPPASMAQVRDNVQPEVQTSAVVDEVGGKSQAPELLNAEVILNAHVQASGGTKAIAAFERVYLEGSLEVLRQNIKGTARQWWRDGKFYGEQELLGIGTSKAGFDGKVVWASDPILGMRMLDGKERELYLRSGSLSLCHEWKQHFVRAETLGETEIDGHKLIEVRLESPMGQKVILGFDVSSNILFSTKFTQVGPTGETEVLALSEDYRAVEGVMFPHKTTLRVGGLMEIVQKVTKIEVNGTFEGVDFGQPGGREVVAADPTKQPANTDG